MDGMVRNIDTVDRTNPRLDRRPRHRRAVKIPWVEFAGSVLVPWYGRMQHGSALADVIYGEAEPGGGLPRPSRPRRSRCP